MNASADSMLSSLDPYSNETEPFYSTLKLPTHMVVVYGIVYSFIFLSAVIGNILIVVVVLRTPRMRTVTNLFIVNLAVADILIAICCIPITFLDNIYSGWPFTAFLCKVTPYIQGVCVCASVYNLAAIAIDRFIAICFHPRWRIMNRTGVVILCFLWLFSFLVQTPWAVYYQRWIAATKPQIIYVCGPEWPDFNSQRLFFVLAMFVGTYLLPLSVILLCYILIALRVWRRHAPGLVVGKILIQRCKKNVIKMLTTVVLMFALTRLPLHVIFLVLYFDPPNYGDVFNQINDVGVPLAQILGLSNSGMNAFIYSFFSIKFRRGFAHIVYGLLPRWKPIRGNSTNLRMTRTDSMEFVTSTIRTKVHRPNSSRGPNDRQFINLTIHHSNSKTHVGSVSHVPVTYSSNSLSPKGSVYV